MTQSDVSIIIPVYNGRKYLRETLESVYSQDFCYSTEVIVVEDGEVQQSCEDIAQNFPGVFFYRNSSNLGVAKTRNTAAQKATGEYLAFLDQDDVWQRTFLRDTYNFLAKNKDVAFTFSNGITVDASTSRLDDMYKHSPGTGLKDFLLDNPIASPSQVLIRRSVFQDSHGFVPCPDGRGADDWGLWLTILAKGYTANYLDEYLVKYRIHPDAAHLDHTAMRANEKWILQKYLVDLDIPERWRRLALAAMSNRYHGLANEFTPRQVDKYLARVTRVWRATRRRFA